VLLGTGLLRRSFAINALYLTMGWLGVLLLRPLWENVPLPAIALLVAGGVSYTIGVGFLCARRLKYRHFIWHLWVIAGTVCHFVAVLLYAH
jgi:hemolysin III